MNGPRHFEEAERLLSAVADPNRPVMTDDADRVVANTIAAAQVHATLALAAATALPAVKRYYGDDSSTDREWAWVAS